jgi:hypothetical protein
MTAHHRVEHAVLVLQQKIMAAERQAAASSGAPADPGRFPMTEQQIALRNYEQRLVQDETARNTDPRYARMGIDDGFVLHLRSGIAGKLTDIELDHLVGHRINGFIAFGNTTVRFGSTEWRTLARTLCISELEVLQRVSERDEGNYDGEVATLLLKDVDPAARTV